MPSPAYNKSSRYVYLISRIAQCNDIYTEWRKVIDTQGLSVRARVYKCSPRTLFTDDQNIVNQAGINARTYVVASNMSAGFFERKISLSTFAPICSYGPLSKTTAQNAATIERFHKNDIKFRMARQYIYGPLFGPAWACSDGEWGGGGFACSSPPLTMSMSSPFRLGVYSIKKLVNHIGRLAPGSLKETRKFGSFIISTKNNCYQTF